jgi:signal peptidase I
MDNRLTALIKENWGFLFVMFLLFASRSTFADWYTVPSGSMQPNILIGDRIFVNKMAYSLEVPFTDIVIAKTGQPVKGDIVVFKSKQADERLVKRVIGVPGDNVAMHNNVLSINGLASKYQAGPRPETKWEITQNYQTLMKFSSVQQAFDSFSEVVVPAGHYLVLGDNRNNSSDSRYIGFVPEAEIQGQAIGVYFSLDANNHYLPRKGRWFSSLL